MTVSCELLSEERTATERSNGRSVDPNFLGGLIEGMRCGILAIDAERRLMLINEVARDVLDLVESPAAGTPIDEALAEHPQLARLLADSFRMNRLPNRAEFELCPGSTRNKTIGFTVSMIPDVQGKPSGAAIFFKDLTRIEHREEQDRLRDRLSALGQMTANLAHDVRNPLAAIEVCCGLIRRRVESDGRSSELLDKITDEVRRLNGRVTASLEFARPLALSFAESDLNEILQQSVAAAAERAGHAEASVRLDRDPSLIPFLMDAENVRIVFENLLLNAFQACTDPGRVRVEAGVVPAPSDVSVPYRREAGDESDPINTVKRFAVVRVSDDGRGISPEELPRLFFPLSTTRKPGSGVGLSMVKKIVDGHDGRIDVGISEEGGALFTVRLPMVCSKERGR